MLGNDQIEALAKRLFRRKAKQRGTGAIPPNDCSGAVGTDHSVSDLIENRLGQFGLLSHGCILLDFRRAIQRMEPSQNVLFSASRKS
jgi:hypothetical protein